MRFILTACSLRIATRQSLATRWKQIYSSTTRIKTCFSYERLTNCGYWDKTLIPKSFQALLQKIDIQTREWRHMHTMPKLCSGFLPHSQLQPIISHPLNAPSTSLPPSFSFFLYLPWSCGCCCKTSVICYSQWRGLLSDSPCCVIKFRERKTISRDGLERGINRPHNFNLSASKKTNNK